MQGRGQEEQLGKLPMNSTNICMTFVQVEHRHKCRVRHITSVLNGVPMTVANSILRGFDMRSACVTMVITKPVSYRKYQK